MTEVMEPLRGDTPSYNTGEWRRALAPAHLFAAGGEIQVPWRQPVDVDGVADRVASVSFIAALPDGEKAEVLDRIRTVASELEGPLALEYVAEVFVFDRVP
jgi:hypothetical protein